MTSPRYDESTKTGEFNPYLMFSKEESLFLLDFWTDRLAKAAHEGCAFRVRYARRAIDALLASAIPELRVPEPSYAAKDVDDPIAGQRYVNDDPAKADWSGAKWSLEPAVPTVGPFQNTASLREALGLDENGMPKPDPVADAIDKGTGLPTGSEGDE